MTALQMLYSDEGTAEMLVERFVVHVALQSAGSTA